MKRLVRKDLYRYSKGVSIWRGLKCFLSTPAFRFMLVLRLCSQYSAWNPVGFVCRFYYRIIKVRFGFQIPFSTRIGGGLYMGHFGNIVVNSKTVIGEDCCIAQGVTIGVVNRGQKKGCPTIGDRVWIGANAVVVGNIKIGSDVLIAPLAYVTDDIPDNAVVVGNPASVINFNGSQGYVNNILE